MSPDLTVIVVNWNTRVLLARCLDSILTSVSTGGPQVETIVVDNASRDGSAVMVSHVYPWVTLLANPSNVGFARANNEAARRAAAPVLLLLNSDAALLPGGIDYLIQHLDAHQRTGVVGLQLRNDDPERSLQPSGRRFPSLPSTIVALSPLPARWREAYDAHRNARDSTHDALVDEVSGAAMAVRRDLYTALGGLDEAFYFFGEDIDLCWRAKAVGYDTVYLAGARAVHTWGSARARTPTVRQGLLSQRAQYLLVRRHRPRVQAAVLQAYLVLFTVARVLLTSARLRGSPDGAAVRGSLNLYAREVRWLLSHG